VPETASPTRRGRLLRIGAAFAVLLAVAAYLVVQYVTGGGGPPSCAVRPPEAGAGVQGYELSPEQAGNAATISAVGTTRGMSERAVTIALATALQESGLRNLRGGDRDSLGLFQQRPSKGWGTAEQILDPVYSAGQFYAHLAKVPGYSRLPLTVAAQRVQHSGFPQAYAKHEPDATLLSAALTGRSAASLTCSAPKAGASGGPAKVRAALAKNFGSGVLPPESAADPAADPAEVSVPVLETAGADAKDSGGSGEALGGSSQRGWELAQWAVAQSAALHIDEVSYAGRVWSAQEAGKGWQHAAGSATADPADSGVVRIRTAR
jgi:hypothetical protein